MDRNQQRIGGSRYGRFPRGAFLGCLLMCPMLAMAAPIEIGDVPVELSIRPAGTSGVRISMTPITFEGDLPKNPALVEGGDPAFVLRELEGPISKLLGDRRVEVKPTPFEVLVSRKDGTRIQKLSFDESGHVRFLLDGSPVLGMGEGGPRPERGKDWRKSAVEYDRRGRLHRMEPRWQTDAYGSRNPVPLMIGTGGWALYFASPWGKVDLRKADRGEFIPIEKRSPEEMRQNHANQREQLGKGIPPMEEYVPGFLDVFIFDARDPELLMKSLAQISGAAAMPPKWALGYMQSHRTLEDDDQMVEIVETFREKKIPLDAVIYLGTGFTPRGWNKPQPSFEFNPEVFKRPPAEVVGDLHDLHAKVVLHMVPWDRDRIPAFEDSMFQSYWDEHASLVKMGVDGWWPDEGDWFDLHERMKRHEFYYKGPQISQPERRPWSLHRNGYLGVARWGGWIWSGDTDSSWKSLEAQIAVGINHSLSLSPFWGSDIGGFFSTPELTGELYARWFQFGAFCPSFRSHGRTWWTRLPWGWGLDSLGPVEDRNPPDASALNDPEIEKIARQYAELRYRLLPYNYSLAWEARASGLPMMRALWLHYQEDKEARAVGDEFLWGRDLLVAPVYEKSAKSRETYLPEGRWYDFWTGEAVEGGRRISRAVDLATMPIYVRAGAILPMDPIRQYVDQTVNGPRKIRVYRGADGEFLLYEDVGDGMKYLEGESSLTRFSWDEGSSTLQIAPVRTESHRTVWKGELEIELMPGGEAKKLKFEGRAVSVSFQD